MNMKGNEFDIAKSVNSQLPFFACRNVVYVIDIRRIYKDIFIVRNLAFLHTKEHMVTNPAKWVEKAFVIKNALAKKEKDIIDGSSRQKHND